MFSSGNGGYYNDSCAANGFVASIYTIAVGSADSFGNQADYDEQCAGKMAVTFNKDMATFPEGNDHWVPYNQTVSLIYS